MVQIQSEDITLAAVVFFRAKKKIMNSNKVWVVTAKALGLSILT